LFSLLFFFGILINWYWSAKTQVQTAGFIPPRSVQLYLNTIFLYISVFKNPFNHLIIMGFQNLIFLSLSAFENDLNILPCVQWHNYFSTE
jgi:hypothetical protein